MWGRGGQGPPAIATVTQQVCIHHVRHGIHVRVCVHACIHIDCARTAADVACFMEDKVGHLGGSDALHDIRVVLRVQPQFYESEGKQFGD